MTPAAIKICFFSILALTLSKIELPMSKILRSNPAQMKTNSRNADSLSGNQKNNTLERVGYPSPTLKCLLFNTGLFSREPIFLGGYYARSQRSETVNKIGKVLGYQVPAAEIRVEGCQADRRRIECQYVRRYARCVEKVLS